MIFLLFVTLFISSLIIKKKSFFYKIEFYKYKNVFINLKLCKIVYTFKCVQWTYQQMK